jgi:hypothetical protein
MKQTKKEKIALHFPAVPLTIATNNRNGKHRRIISEILSDLQQLDEHSALKVNFVEAGVKKADLRSAVHRAAKNRNIDLVTTSDQKNLYVFHRPADRTNAAKT